MRTESNFFGFEFWMTIGSLTFPSFFLSNFFFRFFCWIQSLVHWKNCWRRAVSTNCTYRIRNLLFPKSQIDPTSYEVKLIWCISIGGKDISHLYDDALVMSERKTNQWFINGNASLCQVNPMHFGWNRTQNPWRFLTAFYFTDINCEEITFWFISFFYFLLIVVLQNQR